MTNLWLISRNLKIQIWSKDYGKSRYCCVVLFGEEVISNHKFVFSTFNCNTCKLLFNSLDILPTCPDVHLKTMARVVIVVSFCLGRRSYPTTILSFLHLTATLANCSIIHLTFYPHVRMYPWSLIGTVIVSPVLYDILTFYFATVTPLIY